MTIPDWPPGAGARVRPDLAALPSYVPGRKAPGAIVLASNESPYGLLPGVGELLREASQGVSRYPDMGATALLEAIAAHHGVAPERVAVGAGSVEVLGQLVTSVVQPGDDVVFGWRAFEAYPIVTAVAGGNAVKVPLTAGHVHDVDAMVAALTPRTRAVLVCNPNNPTSTAVGEKELTRVVEAVPDDVLVVVDEAYREYVDPALVPDAFELFGDRPNVAVLRTFSKAYALAGLRVGYCLGAPELVRVVRTCQVPFSVTALAQAAAIAALEQQDEVHRRARLTVAERDRVTAALRAAGYEVPDSQANFVWLPLGERSTAFAEHCAARGVLVRPFAGEGVRVTTGLPEENDALIAAATDFQ
ncbi:MAG: histidinol-phosphate transaminase [Actinomycetes bacterium]